MKPMSLQPAETSMQPAACSLQAHALQIPWVRPRQALHALLQALQALVVTPPQALHALQIPGVRHTRLMTCLAIMTPTMTSMQRPGASSPALPSTPARHHQSLVTDGCFHQCLVSFCALCHYHHCLVISMMIIIMMEEAVLELVGTTMVVMDMVVGMTMVIGMTMAVGTTMVVGVDMIMVVGVDMIMMRIMISFVP